MTKNLINEIDKLNKSIERDFYQLEKIDSELFSIKSTSELHHTPTFKNNFNNYKVEFLLDNKERIYKRYMNSLNQLNKITEKLVAEIEKIKDENIKDIMYLRYINYLSFEKISKILNYSLPSIYKKHNQGCRLIK